LSFFSYCEEADYVLWNKVESVYFVDLPKEISNLPRSEKRIAGYKYRESKLKDFSAEDHLMAARQVCQLIRKQFKERDEDDKYIGAVFPIGACLDAYPSKVSEEDGFKKIISIISDGKEDVLLRRFMIESLESGTPRFKILAKACAKARFAEIFKILTAMICDKTEPVELRIHVLGACRSLVRIVYHSRFNEDKQVTLKAREKGTVIHPDMIKELGIQLDENTKQDLKKIEESMLVWLVHVETLSKMPDNIDVKKQAIRELDCQLLYLPDFEVERINKLKVVFEKDILQMDSNTEGDVGLLNKPNSNRRQGEGEDEDEEKK
jgi:hypothetical protein